MRLSVEIEGLGELQKKIWDLPPTVRKSVQDIINTTGINVQRDAKRACPVDTGRLRSSIKLEFLPLQNGFVATVATEVNYAPHVEFGTKKMARRPFLTPAWEKHRPKYLEDLKKALQEL